MIDADAKRLQARLGVAVDGVLGRVSWRRLFGALGAPPVRADELGMAAAVHLPRFGISESPLRLAHWLAQVAHESGGFRYMEEIASGAAYEGRADLGNMVAGDGVRFKGRGPIQLTGRKNYRRVGSLIGIDLESHPEIAALPSIGVLTACVFWTECGLSAKADRDDLLGITRAINGGTNGIEDRKLRLATVRGLLL